MTQNPEIGLFHEAGDIKTNYHDVGEGHPVLLMHGSGAGVTAWANWMGLIPELSQERRVVAPDLAGFGYTEVPDDIEYRFMDTWVEQMMRLLDDLDIEQTDLVGNSFGGTLAIALAVHHPDRVRRMVLMGSGGQPFTVSPELEALWGYTPSFENMRRILDIMAFDRSLVTDDIADIRYRATIRPGVQERFERIFPPPRQRWADATAFSDEQLAGIDHETLILHGREDRVVPVSVSEQLFQKIDRAQLHIFGRCGHWTQIEQKQRFISLVRQFLNEAEDR